MIITSFSQKGFHGYGRRFLESFIEHGGDESLTVYYERKLPKSRPEDLRISYINLHDFSDFMRMCKLLKASDPLFSGMMQGKKKNELVYNYRFDAAKFWRKVYAITLHAAENTPHLFAWCDADTVIHQDLPADFLKSLKPDDKDFMATLQRPSTYTETGFIVFDTTHPLSQNFMAIFLAMYTTGAFKYLGEWHDCYVFDLACALTEVPIKDITEGKESDHPLIHTVLGKYFDHLKGPNRKKAGRSDPKENKSGHAAKYWHPDQKVKIGIASESQPDTLKAAEA